MLGQKSGFQAYMKAVSSSGTFVPCFIRHLHKGVPSLLSCLNRVIKIVRLVKTSALSTQLFNHFVGGTTHVLHC